METNVTLHLDSVLTSAEIERFRLLVGSRGQSAQEFIEEAIQPLVSAGMPNGSEDGAVRKGVDSEGSSPSNGLDDQNAPV